MTQRSYTQNQASQANPLLLRQLPIWWWCALTAGTTFVRHVAIEPSIAQPTTRARTEVSSLAPFARATGKILVFKTALSSKGTMAWKHLSHAPTT